MDKRLSGTQGEWVYCIYWEGNEQPDPTQGDMGNSSRARSNKNIMIGMI